MLKPVDLPHPVKEMYIRDPEEKDDHVHACVSLATLRVLRVSSGSWIKVAGKESKTIRHARVFADPNMTDDGEAPCIALSPILRLNLGHTNSGVVVAVGSEDAHDPPEEAEEAVLARLITAEQKELAALTPEEIDASLAHHFALPRAVGVDDVFPVSIPSSRSHLWFVVTSLGARKRARISVSSTRLSTVGSATGPCGIDAWQSFVHSQTRASQPAWTRVMDARPDILDTVSARLYSHIPLLLSGQDVLLKECGIRWEARTSHRHLVVVDAFDILSTGRSPSQTLAALHEETQPALALGATGVLWLSNAHALFGGSLADGLESVPEPAAMASPDAASTPPSKPSLGNPESSDAAASSGSKSKSPQLSAGLVRILHDLCDAGLAVVVTTPSSADLPPSVRAVFGKVIRVDAPTLGERTQTLCALLPEVFQTAPAFARSVAERTPGVTTEDLVRLADGAVSHALRRGLSSGGTVRVDRAGVMAAVEDAESSSRSALGVPKVPNVAWDDVGGLESAKREILDTIWLPLQHPELFGSGLRERSGVLLYGPPGTGKTLLAKAVATECSLNFLSVKGPELINMYIGESEKNVRELFARARAAAPCVIFFDELDALAPARGAGADSGGVMDRIVSQLLAELDGLGSSASSGPVFAIGATNRPDLIDPGLLRPGRFDKLVYLGVASDTVSKTKVLSALTRKFDLAPDVSLSDIAESTPDTFTGADFYALASDALLCAIKRLIASGAWEEASSVVVESQDFVSARARLSPSLTPSDLLRYEALRTKYDA